MLRKEVFLKNNAGNLVRVSLEFGGDRISLCTFQEKGEIGHEEGLTVLETLHADLQDERVLHEALMVNTDSGDRIDRISIQLKTL